MLQIIESNPNDYSYLSEIWFETSIIAHPFIDQNLLEDVAKRLESEHFPSTQTFIAIKNNFHVGFISNQGNCVAGLFVHPKYQRMGIGTALLNHIKPFHKELSLQVFQKNIKTLSFYKKYGFIEIAESIHEETGEIQIEMKLQQ